MTQCPMFAVFTDKTALVSLSSKLLKRFTSTLVLLNQMYKPCQGWVHLKPV